MEKLTSNECKTITKQLLKDKWLYESIYLFVYMAIHIAMMFILRKVLGEPGNLETVLVNIIMFPLFLGYLSHIVDVVDDVKTTSIKDIFKYYLDKSILGYLLLNIVVGVVVIMWTILLIIPGIIASLSYTMCMYLKIKNPNKSVQEIMSESKNIMDGNKMDFTILSLSLFGLQLIGFITIVGIIPVSVFSYVATNLFYKNRREVYYYRKDINIGGN